MRGSRRPPALVVLAVVAALAVALGTAPAYASAAKSCTGGFDVNGKASRTNDTWREIHARGTSCSKARATVHLFVRRTEGNPSKLIGKRTQIKDYTCTLKTKQGADNPYLAATCTASAGRRITFVAAG
jgi:hypothetical protein